MESSHHPIMNMRIIATDVAKTFNRRTIFSGISFSVTSPGSLAVTGKNGAGKSTLAKILVGVLSCTSGSVTYELNGQTLDEEERKDHIGFVSPYLNLYDEFSAMENLFLLLRMRSGKKANDAQIEGLLKRFGLWQRRDDSVRGYSSGMKQRLKYVFALAHAPAVLILDEPTTNLDDDGIKVVEAVVAEQEKSSLLVVATNDAAEARWCGQRVSL